MSTPIDILRDEFQRFVREGMSYAEALEMFDEDEFRKAAIEELETVGIRIDPKTYCQLVNDDRGVTPLIDLLGLAHMQQRSREDFEQQAVPLMLAGWTSEVPNPTNRQDPWLQCQTMSLYWRAPSKRPGKPGRRYLSTNQAYRAMMKAQQPQL
jgi:hypothetical protein